MLDPIGIVALILLRRVQHCIGAKFTFTLSVLHKYVWTTVGRHWNILYGRQQLRVVSKDFLVVKFLIT